MTSKKATYCPKCGWVNFLLAGDCCHCCNSQMRETPDEYFLTQEKILEDYDEFIKNEQRLINEVISKLPEFDVDLYNNRDLIMKQKQQQQEESIARGKAILEEKSRVPKCPSCGSSNVSKIGALGRAVSVGIWGLASSKIGKTHKCNNCGTTF